MAKCSSCDSENRKDAAFCNKCGVPLTDPQNVQQNEEVTSKVNDLWNFFFGKGDETKPKSKSFAEELDEFIFKREGNSSGDDDDDPEE